MKREEAADLKQESERKPHFLRETWYCGIINQKIEKAARDGREEVKIPFSARSFPARHQHRFISLYEGQGYEVRFTPNYAQIEPTVWTMHLKWQVRQQT